MDVATLTALAMTGLTTFFAGVADGTAHKVGEAIYEQSKHIYELIRTRFCKDQDNGKAIQALTMLASDPDYHLVVEQKLARILQADAPFAQALLAIIQVGPRQRLTIEEEAVARRIRQSNSSHIGEQTIDIKKKATGEEITQEII